MTDPIDDSEVEAWARAQRRAAGLRIAGVGLLLLLPSALWLFAYASWDSREPITRVKVVGGIAVAIGALLTLAGVVTLVRSRSRPGDPIPPAIARRRR